MTLHPLADPYRRRVLVIIGLVQALLAYNGATLNVGVATIRDSLKFGPELVPWIVTSYTLTSGGLLLLAGRLADLYGQRRILLAGLWIFSILSLLSAAATSAGLFLAAQALKGVGTAFLGPVTFSLLNVLFPEGRSRHAALGFYSILVHAGFAFGNVFGGWIVNYNWRLSILVDVVAGLPLIYAAAAWLKPDAGSPARQERFDYAGAVYSTLGFGALVLTISRGARLGLGSPVTLSLLVISVLLFAGLVRQIRFHPAPIVPPALLKIRDVIGANLSTFFLNACGPAAYFLLSLYLQDVLGYSPRVTGLALVPFAVMALITSFFVNRVLNRFGARRTLILGILIYVAAIGYYQFLSAHSSYWVNVFPALVLMDTGYPLALAALRIPAASGVAEDQQGVANALNSVSASLGVVFGITVVAAVNLLARSSYRGDPGGAVVFGYHWAFGASLFFLLLSLASAVWIIRNPAGVRGAEVLVQPPELAG